MANLVHWIGESLLPVLIMLCWLTLFGAPAVSLLMYPIKKLRPLISVILTWSSYVFGATAWFYGFSLSYILGGFTFLIIGLLIFGVGVVPLAMGACAFNGHWEVFLQLVGLLIMVIVFRKVGLTLYNRTMKERGKLDDIIYPPTTP